MQYRDGIFKIPYLNSWHVVVSGPKLIDELRQAKDHELSFQEAVAEVGARWHVYNPRTHRVYLWCTLGITAAINHGGSERL